MKKILYLLLLITLPVVFTSCSDEPDTIVGKWRLEYVAENGEKYVETVEYGENGNFSTEQEAHGEVYKTRGTYTYDKQTNILETITTWDSDKGILLAPIEERMTVYLNGKSLDMVDDDGNIATFKKV